MAQKKATIKGYAALIAMTEQRLGITPRTKGSQSASARSLIRPTDHASQVTLPSAFHGTHNGHTIKRQA